MFQFRSLRILVVLAAVLLLAACSSLSSQGTDQMVSYTLPQGYHEQFAVDMAGYQLVSLEGPTPSCHIYLLQAPADSVIDTASLQKQVSDMQNTTHKEDLRNVKGVETRTATLRGETVDVLVGEGVNSENVPYREVTAVFTAQNGPALVSISSPVEQWDWEMVDGFLASLQ